MSSPHTACPVVGAAREPPGTCPLDAVWSCLDSGMVLFDIPGQRVWKNKAAELLLGTKEPDADFERLRAVFLSDAEGTTGFRREEVRLGGALIGFSVHRTSPDQVVILMRDITEQRNLESIAAAANLMDNIGYVFAGIRHELGNPINVIKMTLSVLLRDFESMSADSVAEYLVRLTREVGRVEYLLSSLKSFTVYDRPRVGRVDLTDLLTRFADLVCDDLGRRGISLSTRVEPGAEVVFADPRALQQILLNLITNAVDALASREDARVDIRAEVEGKRVALRVVDNGVGIPEDHLAQLFLPFRTTKPKGTGLGLVIVKRTLAAMNGSIAVASSEGAGTTVTLLLPLSAEAPAHRSALHLRVDPGGGT